MATRHYCDHCGNKIKEHNKGIMKFGPFKAIEAHQQMIQYGVTNLQIMSSIVKNFEVMEVDLCDACLPIWYSRVRNLTKSSDPE